MFLAKSPFHQQITLDVTCILVAEKQCRQYSDLKRFVLLKAEAEALWSSAELPLSEVEPPGLLPQAVALTD